jgi:hypothetical protein
MPPQHTRGNTATSFTDIASNRQRDQDKTGGARG